MAVVHMAMHTCLYITMFSTITLLFIANHFVFAASPKLVEALSGYASNIQLELLVIASSYLTRTTPQSGTNDDHMIKAI